MSIFVIIFQHDVIILAIGNINLFVTKYSDSYSYYYFLLDYYLFSIFEK
jgi:hypothetical protein